ncbi:leucine-rich repeat and immunoglobulin-like domain-containing nogo receptor-interacting protein 1 [Aethina tumida]|uniref:leucine-rich repeat and immunoglobulin-like domain-containing nogo receptor-interacting protein 1 n=1 Tax=Aethina tumida TaxID=116153 RepID=UPI002147EB29|nr:leucine-rich repeat and immunoglobulin-like domain-containing nogo receptor-interacting protein 1 [Aethina tumida]
MIKPTIFLLILLIIHSQQECINTPGVTTCKHEKLSAPITVKDYNNLLDFSKGSIEEIKVDTFKKVPNILSLYLGANKIRTIQPGALNGLSKITTISLQSNQLETIQNNVFTCPTLKELSLSLNKIRQIDSAAFVTLQNLLELDLSFNKLTAVPEAIKSLSKLEKLRLDENKIVTLSANSFGNLGKLLNLRLNNNGITNLHSHSLQNLIKLEDLDLRANYLSSLDTQSLTTDLKSLKVIRLNINSFKCGDLRKIVEGFEKKNVEVPGGTSKNPVTYKGMTCKN